MPFTQEQFLEVFAAYNRDFGPFAALLWLVTALAVAWFWRSDSANSRRTILAVLAFHWLWSALIYHAAYFTAINPAAWIFSVLFFAQGIVLLRVASQGDLGPTRTDAMRLPSRGLLVFSLLYPALVWIGHRYPDMPTFGVPCPTVLLTLGLFLSSSKPLSIHLLVIPILWTAIATSAAVSFGILPDLALPIAGLVVIIQRIKDRRPRPRESDAANVTHVTSPGGCHHR